MTSKTATSTAHSAATTAAWASRSIRTWYGGRENCIYGYNPFGKDRIYYDNNGNRVLNRYQPPAWKRANFAHQTPIEACELPEIYARFFNHFLNGDKELQDYISQWCAMTLRDKPLTYLYLSSQTGGVGKGKFSDIMCAVHGTENSTATSANRLTSQFNSLLSEKSFIFIDEINDISGKVYDLVKTFNSPTTVLELKGIDAIMVENHASYCMSTNNLSPSR